jgi:two-component system, NtrC family, response regulator AtoC
MKGECRAIDAYGDSPGGSGDHGAPPRVKDAPPPHPVACRLMEELANDSAPARGSVAGRRLRILAMATADEPDAFQSLKRWTHADGHRVEIVGDQAAAMRRLAASRWDVVAPVLDDDHPLEDLEWWADTVRHLGGASRLVPFTRRVSLPLLLRAEQLSVRELLPLPARRDDVTSLLERLHHSAADVCVPLRSVEAHPVGHTTMVGQSPAIVDVYKMIARVAPSPATVLLVGQSGTGKEVVARAIHAASPRAAGPFIAVNCAAIPDQLLESELFGHEKGAFTGAVGRRTGRFEMAVGGTLFLDEIADMSVALQAKILRGIQELAIERVGGGVTIPVDIRLIAATNRDLHEAIAQNTFREDLYYRLSVFTIRLPSLAEREDDLLLLTSYFIGTLSRQHRKQVETISEDALELLRAHDWVGNVRELQNVLERAVVFAADGVVRAEHLPREFRLHAASPQSRITPTLDTLASVRAEHIAGVLAQTGGVMWSAAGILGIHRNTLARQMREYGI